MHIHVHINTQSQGLESAAMKRGKEQNESIFKAIEFAPTLTEGEHFEMTLTKTAYLLAMTMHTNVHIHVRLHPTNMFMP